MCPDSMWAASSTVKQSSCCPDKAENWLPEKGSMQVYPAPLSTIRIWQWHTGSRSMPSQQDWELTRSRHAMAVCAAGRIGFAPWAFWD